MPKARAYAVAQNVLMGQSGEKAVRNAGYAPSYARRLGWKIAKSDAVKQAMLEIEKNIKPGELGGMAKAVLQADLVNVPKGAKNAKARLGIVRTALEVDGMIGGPSELHLHQHTHLPESVKTMLLDEMKRIQEVEDAEIVPEGASSPSQDQEDDDGIQGRRFEVRLGERPPGQIEVPSDSDSPQPGS